jgi:hypothetical protein
MSERASAWEVTCRWKTIFLFFFFYFFFFEEYYIPPYFEELFRNNTTLHLNSPVCLYAYTAATSLLTSRILFPSLHCSIHAQAEPRPTATPHFPTWRRSAHLAALQCIAIFSPNISHRNSYSALPYLSHTPIPCSATSPHHT